MFLIKLRSLAVKVKSYSSFTLREFLLHLIIAVIFELLRVAVHLI